MGKRERVVSVEYARIINESFSNLVRSLCDKRGAQEEGERIEGVGRMSIHAV